MVVFLLGCFVIRQARQARHVTHITWHMARFHVPPHIAMEAPIKAEGQSTKQVGGIAHVYPMFFWGPSHFSHGPAGDNPGVCLFFSIFVPMSFFF